MSDNDKTQQPRMTIETGHMRERMYKTIAEVHQQLVQAKWQARTHKKPMQLHPMLIVHLEEALTFLAGEVLRLGAVVEALLPKEDAKPTEAEG